AFGDAVHAWESVPGLPATATRYLYAGDWGYETGLLAVGPETLVPPSAGWQHVGERFYDPALGRFLQRDPIGIEGGMNVYLYAANIPNLLVDPTGEAWLAPALHALRVGGRYVAQGARSAWGAAAPYANRAWQWCSNKAAEFARACKSATKNTLRWLNRGKVRIGPSTHQGKTYLSIRLGDRHLDLIEIGDGWRKWYE
ncbi:MAG: RHS repeat-associated core domain-containing protein, partial [Phycisphaerae bacterium]|nr:RHS repeat-associated core domain-containing protein [Phycisphaerae bacterium]